MLTFLPILFFYSHKLHLFFFQVVTIRIFAFPSDCILALLKAVFSPLKKILAVSIGNLLLRNEATVYLVERDCKFTIFWPPDQESLPSMPA